MKSRRIQTRSSSDLGNWGFMTKVEIPDYADPDKTYLRRWSIFRTPFLAVYVHHILLPDDPERGYHDHPWDFITIRLWRTYTEHRLRRARSGVGWVGWREEDHHRIQFRRATDLHQVEPNDERGCWTLVIRGAKKRVWGFQRSDGPWVKHFDWVHEYRVEKII